MAETLTDIAPNYQFVEHGPILPQVLQELDGRNEPIARSPRKLDEPSIELTERECLVQLDSFLTRVENIAASSNNERLDHEVKAFRDNLVFIGAPERAKAIDAIAARIIEKMAQGDEIYFYYQSTRSEQYVSLLVIERLTQLLTELNPDALHEIHFSNSPYAIAQHIRNGKEKASVIIADDFAISGIQIRGNVGNMVAGLVHSGYTREEALRMVEVNLIASAARPDDYRLYPNKEGSAPPFQVFSYYAVPEYRDENGIWWFHPGVSMTGAHSTGDYGFEQVLKHFQKELVQSDQWDATGMESYTDLLLARIKRPYDPSDPTSMDKDPEYAARITRAEQLSPLPEADDLYPNDSW